MSVMPAPQTAARPTILRLAANQSLCGGNKLAYCTAAEIAIARESDAMLQLLSAIALLWIATRDVASTSMIFHPRLMVVGRQAG
jgi:hypothetical protein